MTSIRLTKEFKFEMAHALYGYDGRCKNIHGHSYRLWVTVKGKIYKNANHPKNGMVVDFDVIKKIVKPHIIEKFDHSLVLNGTTSHANIDLTAFEKVYYLPYQPTSENLVLDFSKIIRNQLPENCKLHKIVLSETATSYAEWNSEDQ